MKVNILDYIDKMQVMYGDKDPSSMAQEPRNMADGERTNFLKGRLVTRGPQTGNTAVYYTDNKKAKTKYFKNPEKAQDFIDLRMKNRGGARLGTGPKFKAGKKITFTPKQVLKINEDLPNGIKLRINEQGNAVWQARKTAGPDNVYNKSFAVTNKNPLKDEGLNLIKQEVNTFIDTYLPNRITKEKFEQLRYLDENINLTQTEFAEKLNKQGYTSVSQGKPLDQRTVSRLDSEIGNVKNKSYTLVEQTQFLKNSLDSNEFKQIKDLNLPKDQKESLIRKRANEIRSRDARLTERGVFARGNSREAKLFSNLYQAHTRSNRILIGGEFNGKDLSKRKNWPRDADGNVNWGAKGANGQPAWKSVVFTDTQTPKGSIKLSYNNLKNQVDDAFGSGHFTRSTTAYVTQTQAYKDLGGKDIAKKNIIANYKKKYNGKMPSEAYVEARIANEAPGQVHHWAEGGIGKDPYKVQFVSKSANQAVGNAEKTYKKELRLAGDNPNAIKLAEDNFKKQINKISNDMGGIKYTVGGQTVGKASTVESAYNFENIKNNINQDLGVLGCPKGLPAASGGRIKFKNGSSCVLKGKEKLKLGLTNGFDKTEGELAKKILQAGKGLKNMVALRNILGPAAVGFTVAAEAGLVGYDMLTTGKSFKAAVGDSLFNYALGDKTKIDTKKERYKGYADAGLDANQIGKISQYENSLDEINNVFAEFNEENRLYNIAANQKGSGRMDPTRFKKIKQQQAENFYNQANKNKALIQDLARTQTEDRLNKIDFTGMPLRISEADILRKKNELQKPGPTFFRENIRGPRYKESLQPILNYPQGTVDTMLTGSINRPFSFARGGLSGGDTSGPPPESGPMSQGLRSLYKNGRKL